MFTFEFSRTCWADWVIDSYCSWLINQFSINWLWRHSFIPRFDSCYVSSSRVGFRFPPSIFFDVFQGSSLFIDFGLRIPSNWLGKAIRVRIIGIRGKPFSIQVLSIFLFCYFSFKTLVFDLGSSKKKKKKKRKSKSTSFWICLNLSILVSVWFGFSNLFLIFCVFNSCPIVTICFYLVASCWDLKLAG